jgi:hypothetical protein
MFRFIKLATVGWMAFKWLRGRNRTAAATRRPGPY